MQNIYLTSLLLIKVLVGRSARYLLWWNEICAHTIASKARKSQPHSSPAFAHFPKHFYDRCDELYYYDSMMRPDVGLISHAFFPWHRSFTIFTWAGAGSPAIHPTIACNSRTTSTSAHHRRARSRFKPIIWLKVCDWLNFTLGPSQNSN